MFPDFVILRKVIHNTKTLQAICTLNITFIWVVIKVKRIKQECYTHAHTQTYYQTEIKLMSTQMLVQFEIVKPL